MKKTSIISQISRVRCKVVLMCTLTKGRKSVRPQLITNISNNSKNIWKIWRINFKINFLLNQNINSYKCWPTAGATYKQWKTFWPRITLIWVVTKFSYNQLNKFSLGKKLKSETNNLIFRGKMWQLRWILLIIISFPIKKWWSKRTKRTKNLALVRI